MTTPKPTLLKQLILVCSIVLLSTQGQAEKVKVEGDGGKVKVESARGTSSLATGGKNCYSNYREIESCVNKIMNDVMTQQYSDIGVECCRAMIGIDKECYTQFPYNYMRSPILGPLLQQYCP